MDKCPEIGTMAYLIGVIYMVIEAWLGKTKKVKAGSVLELILTSLFALIVLVLIKLVIKKKDPP